MKRNGLQVVLAVVLAAGCNSLPSVDRDICGNKVLERGEDCDGFADNGAACGAPATVNACFFTCDRDDLENLPCPEGYGCGADDRCRQASGTFVEGESFSFSAERVKVGDLDGDGVPDLVGVSQNRLQVAFGDGGGGQALGFNTPLAVINGNFSIGDLDGDSLADFVVPTLFGVSTFFGNKDRVVRPTAYTALPGLGQFNFARSRARFLGFEADFLFGLIDEAGGPGTDGIILSLFDTNNGGTFTDVFGPGFNFDNIFLPIASADMTPITVTDELAITTLFADRVWVVDSNNLSQAATQLLLPNGTSAAGRVFVDNLNGDADFDFALMINIAGAQVALATRDGSAGAFSTPPGTNRPAGTELLDVKDINGDGVADYVLTGEIRLGAAGSINQLIGPLATGSWANARIVDVNNDQRMDVVAVPTFSSGLEVFLQADDLRFNRFVVGSLPVITGRTNKSMMEVGDFDGDLIDDVAIALVDPSLTGDQVIAVLFGSPGGGFGDPQIMGTFPVIDQLVGSIDFTGRADGIDDLLVAATPDLALMQGDSSRQMIAPLILSEEFEQPVGSGNFESVAHIPLDAIIALTPGGEPGIWSPTISSGDGITLADGQTPDCPVLPSEGCPAAFFVPVGDDGILDPGATTQINLDLLDDPVGCFAFAAADVNGEPGDELLALTAQSLCPGLPTQLRYLDIVAEQFVEIPWPASVESADQLASSDLDGDGKIEIIAFSNSVGAATSGNFPELPVTIFWNDGGAFSNVEVAGSGLAVVTSVQAGRIDASARLELVVGGIAATGSGFEPRLLLATYDEAEGKYSEFIDFPIEGEALASVVTDFNADGLDDVISINGFTATVFLGQPILAGDVLADAEAAAEGPEEEPAQDEEAQ